MIGQLHNFPGGIKLTSFKRSSTDLAVRPARMPKKIILPLCQHIGNPAEPVVHVGEKVYKGQIVAQYTTNMSVPVHASTSGTVIAIEDHPVPHPSGLPGMCIIIETDGLDQVRRSTPRYIDYKQTSPADIRDIIHNAGIVGLGGAGFPSFIKLDSHDKPVKTLILNGAECEPYITCDDMLMREQSVEIVEGLLIIQHALHAENCIIAIENNKPKAYESIRQAVLNLDNKFNDEDSKRTKPNIEVIKVPTVYPAGGEKQLIQVLTGKEVPSQGIPLDINIVCLNVATAYAVCRAVEHGEPLISRYVTIAGSVAKGRNLEVLIGTPMKDLIEECGGNSKTLNRVIMGGPMMGFALHDENAPTVKTTNCILANSVISDVPMASRLTQSLPCIRCGSCVEVCPMHLLPHQLYWYAKAKDFDRVQEFNLFDCIECGCCDYVCPSHIPLVHYYRYAKSTIWNQERQKHKSDASRERHEFHLLRLEREKQERAAKHKQKREQISEQTDEDKKKAAIQAAMDRARAKKENAHIIPKNVSNLTPEQQKLIDEADARRAQDKQKIVATSSKDTKQ